MSVLSFWNSLSSHHLWSGAGQRPISPSDSHPETNPHTGMGVFLLYKYKQHINGSCAHRRLIRIRNRSILSLLFKTKKRRMVSMQQQRDRLNQKLDHPITLLIIHVNTAFGFIKRHEFIQIEAKSVHAKVTIVISNLPVEHHSLGYRSALAKHACHTLQRR